MAPILMTSPALASWRFFGYLACFGAVLGGVWFAGYRYGYSELEADWNAQQLRQQQDYNARVRDYAEQVEAMRLQEHERTTTYEDRLRTVGRQRDAAVASLRDRPERAAVPASGAGTEACQGSTGAALAAEDARFLIREATRSDELRAALERCQGGDQIVHPE